MSEKRSKYDREFREGAVRIVNETKKPVAVVARDLGVNESTLGNWVAREREVRQGTDGLSKGDIEELKRLPTEKRDKDPPRSWGNHTVPAAVVGHGAVS